jgi:hypothetical protein
MWFPVIPSISCAAMRHAVADLTHASFEHVAHAQVARDPAYVRRFSLIGERRIACDDEERAQFRQRGDDVLGHAISEKFLLRVAAQVLERLNRDGGLSGSVNAGWTGDAVSAPVPGTP